MKRTKRSQHIDLQRMRKRATGAAHSQAAMILVTTTSTLLLQACSSGSDHYQDAEIFRTVAECEAKHPEFTNNECELAYKTALKEALSSGPKYQSKSDCEAEFGYASCFEFSVSDETDDIYAQVIKESNLDANSNWFMPALGGFLVGNLLSYNASNCPIGYYRTAWGCQASSAVYRYSGSNYSNGPGWYSTSGHYYGDSYRQTVKIKKDSFKPKPKKTKTIARGGFGSTVKAKSWSASSKSYSSSRRSSWGG